MSLGSNVRTKTARSYVRTSTLTSSLTVSRTRRAAPAFYFKAGETSRSRNTNEPVPGTWRSVYAMCVLQIKNRLGTGGESVVFSRMDRVTVWLNLSILYFRLNRTLLIIFVYDVNSQYDERVADLKKLYTVPKLIEIQKYHVYKRSRNRCCSSRLLLNTFFSLFSWLCTFSGFKYLSSKYALNHSIELSPLRPATRYLSLVNIFV